MRITLGEKKKPGVETVAAHVAVGIAVGAVVGKLVGASVRIRATADDSCERR